jgi:hypothetical protein
LAILTWIGFSSIQHERSVNNDNTARLANMGLQIEPTERRSTLAGCRVIIEQRLNGLLVIENETG